MFTAVLLAGLLASGDRVAACSCLGGVPACARVDAQAPAALFIGQVLDIEVTDEGLRVRMQVGERFRGSAEGQVDLFTGDVQSASTCAHYPFVPGETYLVYAARNAAGQLTAGLCSGTARLDQVPDADLTWLRSGPGQADGLRVIQGTVWRWDMASGAPNETRMPLAGARIVATAEGDQFEGLSDSDGVYRIAAPPGAYIVAADLPPGLHAEPRTVTLGDGPACSVADISARLDGRLAGRLVDARGLPVAHLTVDAHVLPGPGVPSQVSRLQHRAISDLDGRYEIARLPPGQYAISVDTRTGDNAAALHILYPGTREATAAQTVAVGAGERVALPDFALPPALDLVTVTGMVRDSAGRPVEGVQIYLAHETGASWAATKSAATDLAGEFRIAVPAGRMYRLRAERTLQGRVRGRSDLPAFEATAAMPAIDIVLADP